MEYKGFVEEDNQAPLRERLIRCMKMDPKTFCGFCKEIGIVPQTLRRFLHDINVKFVVRCKIEAWCDKAEKVNYK